jgi:hypothetical protein
MTSKIVLCHKSRRKVYHAAPREPKTNGFRDLLPAQRFNRCPLVAASRGGAA